MKSLTIVVATSYLRDVFITLPGITDDPDCEACLLPAEIDPSMGDGYYRILEADVPWVVAADKVAVIQEHE